MKFLQNRLLKSLAPYLDEREEVLEHAWGSHKPGGSFGLTYLGLTPTRVLMYHRGLLGYAFSYIPLNQVTLVDESSGTLSNYALRIHSTTGSLVFYPSGGRREREQVQALARMIRHRTGADTGKPKDADATEALRTLRDLRKMCDEGLISEEEYAQKKRNILEQM